MSEIRMRKRDSSQALMIPTIPGLMLALSLLLTSTLLSLLLSLVISFRLGDMMARPNPFNTYEIIWPGGTLEAVAEYAHRTPKGYMVCYANIPLVNPYPDVLRLVVSTTEMLYEPAQPTTCTADFEQGTFRSIKIAIVDDQIRELYLFSDTLGQDVLTLYWGAPDSISKARNGEKLYLHWDHSTYKATATINKPYSIVSLVTVVAKP